MKILRFVALISLCLAISIAWAGGDAPVQMTGPAAEVFTGHIPIEGD